MDESELQVVAMLDTVVNASIALEHDDSLKELSAEWERLFGLKQKVLQEANSVMYMLDNMTDEFKLAKYTRQMRSLSSTVS